MAEPRWPNITRHGSGSGITGSVAIGVNKANTIWCSARADVWFLGRNVLSALFWQYSNGTRLPAVGRGQSSGHDMYMERYSGSGSANYATEFFISRQHHLLLLEIIHVLPFTTRGIGIKVWKF